ncbi:MAG: hypothetical protein ACI4NA_06110, partial [Succinivibrio sp.]
MWPRSTPKSAAALSRTASVSAPAGRRYAPGEARIYNAGWMILQKALNTAGLSKAAPALFEEASYQDKDGIMEVLAGCICERALSLGAKAPPRAFLGMKCEKEGSIPGSLARALLRAAPLCTAFASDL